VVLAEQPPNNKKPFILSIPLPHIFHRMKKETNQKAEQPIWQFLYISSHTKITALNSVIGENWFKEQVSRTDIRRIKILLNNNFFKSLF
jgi:hypothetical protein